MTAVQLTGTAEFGPEDQTTPTVTDYKDQISSVVISRDRATVAVPANLGNGRETQVAGSVSETLTINFFSEMAAAAFWNELWDAIDTDSGLLYFNCLLEPGAVGPDNPSFSGWITVTGVQVGGDVGSLRSQSQTFPVFVGTPEGGTYQAGVTKATA